jgi:hypothetical protein
MNAAESLDNPEGLTLPLLAGDQPFALSGEEKGLSPDDWAWLFLSLNDAYRAAYAAYRDKYDRRPRGSTPKASLLSRYIFDADDRKMMPDEDGFSAHAFGIAAWLSPSVDRLPKINNGSWFFPLKRVGSTSHFTPENSDRPYPYRTSPYSRKNSDVHQFITETPFGYCLRAKAPLCKPQDIYTGMKRNWILTVIDCRIPPAAQVEAARNLAGLICKLSEIRATDSASPRVLVDPSYADVISNTKLQMHNFASKAWANLPAGMHTLAIDSHSFLAADIGTALVQLNEKHQALIKKKQAARPPLRDLRFKSSLPAVKDKDGIVRNGGSRLKALHVIAELTDRGVSKKQIAEITRTDSNGNGYQFLWQKEFEEEISNYIDDAKVLVEGGYRWLVQAQKPDYTSHRQPSSSKPTPPTFRQSR